MRTFTASAAIAAMTLALAACGKPAEDKSAADTAAAPSAAASVASAGERPSAFAQCAACHAVEKGKHGVGPSLAGIMGTKAGAVEGYAFSDAMKASGVTWDEASLDTWLTNPAKMIPGTKMVYAGMADPADRKAVIDYIKTLK